MAVSSAEDYSMSFQICTVISCLSLWEIYGLSLSDIKEGVSSQEGQ